MTKKQPNGAREANTPAKLEMLDKSIQWLEMRRQGMTYTAIGAMYGCTKQNVWAVINRRVMQIEFEAVDAYREYELELLGLVQESIIDKATDGDLPAIDRLLRISERRARLLGLDRPQAFALIASGSDAVQVEPMETYKAALQSLTGGDDETTDITITAPAD